MSDRFHVKRYSRGFLRPLENHDTSCWWHIVSRKILFGADILSEVIFVSCFEFRTITIDTPAFWLRVHGRCLYCFGANFSKSCASFLSPKQPNRDSRMKWATMCCEPVLLRTYNFTSSYVQVSAMKHVFSGDWYTSWAWHEAGACLVVFIIRCGTNFHRKMYTICYVDLVPVLGGGVILWRVTGRAPM